MNKIVLASSSPRRLDILKQHKLDIEVIPSNIIEMQRENEKAEQVAMSLAFQKALSISTDRPDKVVLGADTIVVLGNTILGKPDDKKDAFKILNSLNNRTHRVITGISIIKGNKKIIDYESTLVKFKKISKDQITKYINTGEPMDKAGAYGIQGHGKILVEKIDGSYSNVVGLPIAKTKFLLTRFFDIKIL